MALLKSGRTVLIGILVVISLLVASCETSTTTTTPREAGDTLGLDGGTITLLGGSETIDPTGFAGIGAQQEEDVRTGTFETVDPVVSEFPDRPELADLRPNQIVRWRQDIGFDSVVTATPPTGFEGTLPDVIIYNEAEFEATIIDVGLDVELEIEIESDDEAPIRLVRGEGNVYTFENAREFTQIRLSGQEVRDLFEILTEGSEQNQITFSLSLDYEIDTDAMIPPGTTFEYRIVTEFGFFETR